MKPAQGAPILKLGLGAGLGLALCVGLLVRKPAREAPPAEHLDYPRPLPSARLEEAGPPMAPSSAVDPTATVPAPRTAEELVRASIGRWRGEDGTIVEIDPPRPRLGARPPFHLVVSPKGRLGYGCDFTDAETFKKKPDESERTFRAWCGAEAKGKRTALGLTLDAGLSVSLLVDGEWKLTAVGLAKQTGR